MINLILQEPNRARVTEHFANLRQLQLGETIYRDLIYHVTRGKWPRGSQPRVDILRSADLFIIDEAGYLCKTAPDGHAMVCLPPILHHPALYDAHTAPFGGHFGIAKTVERVRHDFWWPSLPTSVSNYIKRCPLCLAHKNPSRRHVELMGMRPPPTRIWERLHMDVWAAGGTSSADNVCIIALVDTFSKFVVAVPLPDHKAETYIDAIIQSVILTYGMPEELVSDGAPEFRGGLQKEMFKIFGVTRKITSPYRPQTNGTIERIFRTIRPVLAALCANAPRDWDLLLPYALFAYNTSFHASIGNTPFNIMFGRDATLPIFLGEIRPGSNADRMEKWDRARESVKDALLKEQGRSQRFYDVRARPQNIKVGDCVLLKVTKTPSDSVHKMHPKYVGPFRVLRSFGTVLHVVPIHDRLPHGQLYKRIHLDLVRKCEEDYPHMHTITELLSPFLDPAYGDENLDVESQD